MRKAEGSRKTNETAITAGLCLDGKGQADVATGIGFFDHMLTLAACHGLLDLTIRAQGDLAVDSHHTVEDCGIVLGSLLKEALGDKAGINRYGHAAIPMDETLAMVSLDISGRPYLVFNVKFPKTSLGAFELELVEEFFRAVAVHGGLTLHVNMLYGANTHHMAEAIFKGFGRALARAVALNPRTDGAPSTKGSL